MIYPNFKYSILREIKSEVENKTKGIFSVCIKKVFQINNKQTINASKHSDRDDKKRTNFTIYSKTLPAF